MNNRRVLVELGIEGEEVVEFHRAAEELLVEATREADLHHLLMEQRHSYWPRKIERLLVNRIINKYAHR